MNLQQRLLSSIKAFARTLRVHRRTVQRQWTEAQTARAAAEAERLDLLAAPVGGDDDQATLGEEELQAEGKTRRWNKRLAALSGELEREPARIREVYAVRATRLEPVGLVYLWPVTG